MNNLHLCRLHLPITPNSRSLSLMVAYPTYVTWEKKNFLDHHSSQKIFKKLSCFLFNYIESGVFHANCNCCMCGGNLNRHTYVSAVSQRNHKIFKMYFLTFNTTNVCYWTNVNHWNKRGTWLSKHMLLFKGSASGIYCSLKLLLKAFNPSLVRSCYFYSRFEIMAAAFLSFWCQKLDLSEEEESAVTTTEVIMNKGSWIKTTQWNQYFAPYRNTKRDNI